MKRMADLILKGVTLVNHDGVGVRDLAILEGRIVGLGDLSNFAAAETLDCKGLHILPGVIDSQVHLREPGLEHKEDPLAVLRLPTYRPFAIGRLLSATAVMLFTSTVFWQVFKISDSEAQLAVVGLVQFVPAVGLTLGGGVAPDRYDKRRLFDTV